jgi:hypothetical protein
MPSAQPSVIIRRDDRNHSTGGTTKARIAFGVGGELPGGGAFDPEVQLLHHHAFEMRDHVARPQPARGGRQRLDPGDQVEGVDILAKRPLHAGPQDLDRHVAAGSGQPRLVHLRDGGRGDGFRTP